MNGYEKNSGVTTQKPVNNAGIKKLFSFVCHKSNKGVFFRLRETS